MSDKPEYKLADIQDRLGKVYIICPVRKITDKQRKTINDYVAALEEEGFDTYLPYRDTPQDSETGFEICYGNCEAIACAIRVDIFWADSSEASRFDLGMAFALGRPIKIVEWWADIPKPGKSFYAMTKDWSGRPWAEIIDTGEQMEFWLRINNGLIKGMGGIKDEAP